MMESLYLIETGTVILQGGANTRAGGDNDVGFIKNVTFKNALDNGSGGWLQQILCLVCPIKHQQ